MRNLLLMSLVVYMAIPSGAHSEAFVYNGMCDASAAVALDASHFVVANDEQFLVDDSKLDFLKVFEFGRPDAISGLALTQYLRNPEEDGEGKETDIEGAARIANRIYWISSHGRNKHGKREKSRLKFFATEIKGIEVELSPSTPYDNLLKDMLADEKLKFLGLAEASGGFDDRGKAPKDEGGFNIEGLAATPDGKLLIGFRNPQHEEGSIKKAIVVPLNNPAELVDKGRDKDRKAQFGIPVTLDLGGNGIRSIEWIDDHYVIVAGAYGNGGNYGLYGWSGNATEKPTPIAADLSDLSPEAVFQRPGSEALQILSDDGKRPINGKDCNQLLQDQQHFRAVEIGPILN